MLPFPFSIASPRISNKVPVIPCLDQMSMTAHETGKHSWYALPKVASWWTALLAWLGKFQNVMLLRRLVAEILGHLTLISPITGNEPLDTVYLSRLLIPSGTNRTTIGVTS